MKEAVISTREAAIAWIRLNRPERLNAMNRALVDGCGSNSRNSRVRPCASVSTRCERRSPHWAAASRFAPSLDAAPPFASLFRTRPPLGPSATRSMARRSKPCGNPKLRWSGRCRRSPAIADRGGATEHEP